MIIYLILGINLYAYSLMWIDKRKAIKGNWRISERQLLLTGCAFGSIGIILGMFPPIRHKKNKWQFKYLMPLAFLVQSFLLLYYFQIISF